MAKERTTSAREFLLADSNRDAGPERLSDWLTKDLKGARRSSVPPPPERLESQTEPALAEGADVGVVETSDEQTAHSVVDDPAADGVSRDLTGSQEPTESPELAESREPTESREAPESREPGEAPELSESRELAELLSYAHEGESTGQSPESEAVATEPADTKVYANAEDWLDDDRDSETTAAFFTPRPVLEDDEDAVSEPAPVETGASLSPQVLTPEDDSDEGGAVVVAGIGGFEWWKVAAGVVAALLLLFMVVHRTKKAPQAAAAAHADIVAPIAPPANAIGSDEAPAEAAEQATEAKGSHGEAFGGTRGHGSSTSDATSQDPSLPGGPSVARFPDLPREILIQLEQAFQAGEQQHTKSGTDSVERY
jgi:hypothetical protein